MADCQAVVKHRGPGCAGRALWAFGPERTGAHGAGIGPITEPRSARSRLVGGKL
jgi:hypothetical protein